VLASNLSDAKARSKKVTVVAVANLLLVVGQLVSTFIGEEMCFVRLIIRRMFFAQDELMLTRFSFWD
jgi:hypothetical protein